MAVSGESLVSSASRDALRAQSTIWGSTPGCVSETADDKNTSDHQGGKKVLMYGTEADFLTHRTPMDSQLELGQDRSHDLSQELRPGLKIPSRDGLPLAQPAPVFDEVDGQGATPQGTTSMPADAKARASSNFSAFPLRPGTTVSREEDDGSRSPESCTNLNFPNSDHALQRSIGQPRSPNKITGQQGLMGEGPTPSYGGMLYAAPSSSAVLHPMAGTSLHQRSTSHTGTAQSESGLLPLLGEFQGTNSPHAAGATTPANKRRTHRQGMRCFNCHKTGHYSTECPEPQMILCYNCREVGHKTFECPHHSACRYCGERGHKEKQCPHKNAAVGPLQQPIPNNPAPGGFLCSPTSVLQYGTPPMTPPYNKQGLLGSRSGSGEARLSSYLSLGTATNFAPETLRLSPHPAACGCGCVNLPATTMRRSYPDAANKCGPGFAGCNNPSPLPFPVRVPTSTTRGVTLPGEVPVASPDPASIPPSLPFADSLLLAGATTLGGNTDAPTEGWRTSRSQTISNHGELCGLAADGAASPISLTGTSDVPLRSHLPPPHYSTNLSQQTRASAQNPTGPRRIEQGWDLAVSATLALSDSSPYASSLNNPGSHFDDSRSAVASRPSGRTGHQFLQLNTARTETHSTTGPSRGQTTLGPALPFAPQGSRLGEIAGSQVVRAGPYRDPSPATIPRPPPFEWNDVKRAPVLFQSDFVNSDDNSKDFVPRGTDERLNRAPVPSASTPCRITSSKGGTANEDNTARSDFHNRASGPSTNLLDQYLQSLLVTAKGGVTPASSFARNLLTSEKTSNEALSQRELLPILKSAQQATTPRNSGTRHAASPSGITKGQINSKATRHLCFAEGKPDIIDYEPDGLATGNRASSLSRRPFLFSGARRRSRGSSCSTDCASDYRSSRAGQRSDQTSRTLESSAFDSRMDDQGANLTPRTRRPSLEGGTKPGTSDERSDPKRNEATAAPRKGSILHDWMSSCAGSDGSPPIPTEETLVIAAGCPSTSIALSVPIANTLLPDPPALPHKYEATRSCIGRPLWLLSPAFSIGEQ